MVAVVENKLTLNEVANANHDFKFMTFAFVLHFFQIVFNCFSSWTNYYYLSLSQSSLFLLQIYIIAVVVVVVVVVLCFRFGFSLSSSPLSKRLTKFSPWERK